MRRPAGVTLILGSRRSPSPRFSVAARSHFSASVEVRTQMAPSGETWASPSRNVQNQRFLKKVRSVKALCLASSEILITPTSTGLAVEGALRSRGVAVGAGAFRGGAAKAKCESRRRRIPRDDSLKCGDIKKAQH